VPVPTLRVWEVRYATFRPRLTEGRQRLYCDDDVLRATLLKRLTEEGHTISRIAHHNAAELNAMLQQQIAARGGADSWRTEQASVSAAVIGRGLAARLASKKFTQIFAASVIQVTDIFADLETALQTPPTASPQFLLVSINSLHTLVEAALHRLIACCNFPQVIVLYRFGQEPVIQSMRRSGMVLRREPVSDHELADLMASSLLIDAPRTMGQDDTATIIPPRRYDDTTLARMAAISTDVLCECPRHVAEIIAQLVSFEQYSQECLNKSTEDAHLHAYLHSVSGSARALFEHALQKVAEHEGLVLSAPE
jgi:DNA-binding transcriptional MerR regulator